MLAAAGEQAAIAKQAADVRMQLFDRLILMSARLAALAWDNRGGVEVCPHAVAYHFLEPDIAREARARKARDEIREQTGDLSKRFDPRYDAALGLGEAALDWYVVRTATRAILHGDEVAEASVVLRLLHDAAKDHLSRGPLDVRNTQQMSTNSEPMSPHAMYIGMSICTLDAPGQPWSETSAMANTPLQIPGRTLTLLSDGTYMVIDHRGGDHPRVRSTHSLNVNPLQYQVPWRQIDHPMPTSDPRTGRIVGHDLPSHHVWQAMYDLHALIYREHSRRRR